MYSLIITAKLNDVDPRAWLADVLRRIADHSASRLHELLPWNWQTAAQGKTAASWINSALRPSPDAYVSPASASADIMGC